MGWEVLSYSSYRPQQDCDFEVLDALNIWQLYLSGNMPPIRTVMQLCVLGFLMHLLATVSNSVIGWEQEP